MEDKIEPHTSEPFLKQERPKYREVSSRFLPSNSAPSLDSPHYGRSLSSTRRKSRTVSTENRNFRSQEGSELSSRGLWPSSSTASSSNKKFSTLADHLGNERLFDHQKRTSSERSLRSSHERKAELEAETAKENHRPGIGGSMRYLGNSHSARKYETSLSFARISSQNLEPGRLSVDENALFGKSTRQSDIFKASPTELESDYRDLIRFRLDISSPDTGKNKKVTSGKFGVEVSSRYLNTIHRKAQRGSSDSNIPNAVSLDSSPKLRRFTLKNMINRANSISGRGSAMSQWALSPGRSGSPPMSVENKERPMSFSSLKPHGSPSKTKRVEKLLNLGLDLFKSKRTPSPNTSAVAAADHHVHQLRLLHNQLLKWRYANAKADTVNANIAVSAQMSLLCAWLKITKLQRSVLQKKLQLQKEKLGMKLNLTLLSQLKQLETWRDMERQHMNAVSMVKDCLHSIVCRVPLIEGAKMDGKTTFVALRHASDLMAMINSMLSTNIAWAHRAASIASELAKVVAQEKLLMEECFELCGTASLMEIEERSLMCCIIQLQRRNRSQKP